MQRYKTLIVTDVQEGFMNREQGSPFIDKCKGILIDNVKKIVQETLDGRGKVIVLQYEGYGGTIRQLEFLDHGSSNIVQLKKRSDSVFHPFGENKEYSALAIPYMDEALKGAEVTFVGLNASYCVLANCLDMGARRNAIPRFLENSHFAELHHAQGFSEANKNNFSAIISARRDAILNLDRVGKPRTNSEFMRENSVVIEYAFERERCTLEGEYIVLSSK